MVLTISEFKKHINHYISLLENGEEDELMITKYGKVVASFTPKRMFFNAGKRKFGEMQYNVKGSEYNDIVKSFYK